MQETKENLIKYSLKNLPDSFKIQPKGKFFNKEALLKRKKKQEFKRKREKIEKNHFVNLEYHSVSPQKCRKGASIYPKIEIFLSFENFKIDEKILCVIKKQGELSQTQTEAHDPSEGIFKTTFKTQFIFEKEQKINMSFWTVSNLFLGKVSFMLGQLVGSLENKLILDLNGGELGTKKDTELFDYKDKEKRARTIVYFKSLKPSEDEKQRVKELRDFLDFLKGNLKIQVVTAIDFTASNNHTLSGDSLHKLYPHKLNEYQSAIASICSILLNYDFDKEIQVYGFGAYPLKENFDHLRQIFDGTDESLKYAIRSFQEYSKMVRSRSQSKNKSKSRDKKRKRGKSKSSGMRKKRQKTRRVDLMKRPGSIKEFRERNNNHDSQIRKVHDFNHLYKLLKRKPSKHKVSHFFPLTGNWRESAGKKIEGVFEIYTNLLKDKFIDMGGPTLFSPMLEEINRIASDSFQSDPYCYTILLIMTDGVIHDMEETIEQLIDSSMLPMSIVIVGLGYEDFTYMKILDSDHYALKDKIGRKSERDVVQFVDYSMFNENEKTFKLLPEEVLSEIPRQVCSFYQGMNIKPKKPLTEVQKMVDFISNFAHQNENNEAESEVGADEEENNMHMTGNLSRKSGYLGKNKMKKYVYTKLKSKKKKNVKKNEEGSASEVKKVVKVKRDENTDSSWRCQVPDEEDGIEGKIKNFCSNGLITKLKRIYD